MGHDRIQQGKAESSIGESIRKWFNLKDGDFERIDVDIQVYDHSFYLTPFSAKYAAKGREQSIARVEEAANIFSSICQFFLEKSVGVFAQAA